VVDPKTFEVDDKATKVLRTKLKGKKESGGKKRRKSKKIESTAKKGPKSKAKKERSPK
jgi:hypothetical protein